MKASHALLLSLFVATSQAVVGHVLAPTTISLTSRSLPRESWQTRRSLEQKKPGGNLKQKNLPLKDYFKGTDLQWYGEVEVGTPAQTFRAVFDTGSDTFELVGKNCTTAGPQQRKYDWDKSSTYKYIDNGDGLFLQFATGVGVTPDNATDPQWTLTMFEVQDTVSVAGLQVPEVPFWAIANQSEAFSEIPFDGIMGLSTNASSYFGKLVEQGLPSLFSFYLTPKSVGKAELTLGGVDKTKFKGELSEGPLIEGSGGLWALFSQRIVVNEKSSEILETPYPIIFDSGTSNLVFPQNYTEAMYALISNEIIANPDLPGTYGLPCSKIDHLPAVIDFTFTSTAGKPFNLTLPSSELNVGPFEGNSSLCQTMINAWTFDVPAGVIGGSLLKHYYSVWNSANQTLGFAEARHSDDW